MIDLEPLVKGMNRVGYRCTILRYWWIPLIPLLFAVGYWLRL